MIANIRVSTLLALLIRNRTKSCILLQQYDNGVWTIPATAIEDPSPGNIVEVHEFFKKITGANLLSAINVVDDWGEDADHCYRSIIYDVQTSSKVDPSKAKHEKGIITSQWVNIQMLSTKVENEKISWPLSALMMAIEKQPSLL